MWVGMDRIDMMDKTRTAVGRRVKAGGRQIIAGGVNHRFIDPQLDKPSGRHSLSLRQEEGETQSRRGRRVESVG